MNTKAWRLAGCFIVIGTGACPACQRGVESLPSTHRFPLQELSVECTLRVEKKGADVLAFLVFKNPRDWPQPITKRNLLQELQMTFCAFKIARDGEEVGYKGMCVKRGPPTEKDWYWLEPQESYETTIRLSRYYDLRVPGTYHVYYQSFELIPNGKDLVEIKSNPVELVVAK